MDFRNKLPTEAVQKYYAVDGFINEIRNSGTVGLLKGYSFVTELMTHMPSFRTSFNRYVFAFMKTAADRDHHKAELTFTHSGKSGHASHPCRIGWMYYHQKALPRESTLSKFCCIPSSAYLPSLYQRGNIFCTRVRTSVSHLHV